MRKAIIIVMAMLITFSLAACTVKPSDPGLTNTDTAEPRATTEPTATQAPTATEEPTTSSAVPTEPIDSTPAPVPETTPVSTKAGETPDHAGSGDLMFDIYVRTAFVDLDNDGIPEELVFTKGNPKSSLAINGVSYPIDHAGLAQLFAVTDIDISDHHLEIAFTDQYDSDLADTEFPFTWLYWWDGTKLIQMGGLMNVKFAGAWRSTFHAKDHFDGHGLVKCLTRTQHFTDIWYTGHYTPKEADRRLVEVLYEAKPLFHPAPVRARQYILLLKNRTNTYYDPSYSVMWDYASCCGGYEGKPRNHSDDKIAFIPQAGEELTVTAVYGKQWFKLAAVDGKQGWLRCKNMKVYGYWPTLGADYTADNLFDNIVVGG